MKQSGFAQNIWDWQSQLIGKSDSEFMYQFTTLKPF